MAPEIDAVWWDDGVLDGRPIREALARRDVSAVFRFLRRRGFSRARLAALTGLSETRVRQIWRGQQQVSTYEVLERIALGLRIPRSYLGIGYGGDGKETMGVVPVDDSPPGLVWHASLRDTVDTVADLWRADMERRALLSRSTWLAGALAAPTRDWLLDLFDDEQESQGGGRSVGEPEVAVVWAMCGTFTDADHRLGGGYARAALGQYVTDAVLPMLSGSYSAQVGRELLSGAARLCNLGGFMAFDCGLNGLAQRYFVQALRLAQAARNRALGGHILGDMAMQAHYLGEAGEAAALASTGLRTATATGSMATVARCQALLARSRALQGDRRGCDEAMSRAEDALGRVDVDCEPTWTRFFTPMQLQAEFAYAAADLGRCGQVQKWAPAVIAASAGMERRRLLLTTTLTASYLPAPGTDGGGGDVEQACAVLGEVAPELGSLTTQRGRQAVTAVRQRLRPYADRSYVQQLDAVLGAAL